MLPVLEYCSAVWCSAADSHLKLLGRVVRSAGFLAGGVLDCNLAHRRSVAELCMLFRIKSNPMHSLSGALPLPYVPTRVTRGALVAHRHSFAPPRCRTSQYPRTFVPFSVSLSSFPWLVMWGWGLWTDRVFSLSPGFAQRSPNDDNNNNGRVRVPTFINHMDE